MEWWKKAVFMFAFSLFSAVIFAAPGGPGGPSGGKSRPGGRSAPSERREPSRTKPSSSSKNSRSSGKTVPESSRIQQKSPSEPKNAGEAENQKAEPEIIYYRGNRILSENAEFNLQSVKTERTGKSEVTVEIAFNQSVNPRSFSSQSILLDGEAISSKTKFSFNKKGDTIRIVLPVKNESFSLTIQNVESFDGTALEAVEVKNLSQNSGGK